MDVAHDLIINRLIVSHGDRNSVVNLSGIAAFARRCRADTRSVCRKHNQRGLFFERPLLTLARAQG